MKSLLTAAFCIVTICVLSQTHRCDNATWETIVRQIKAYKLLHTVTRHLNISSFSQAPVLHAVEVPFRPSTYICNNPPRSAYSQLPADVFQILKDHPVQIYNACVDGSMLDRVKYSCKREDTLVRFTEYVLKNPSNQN